jgi:hypothetical protein
MATVVFGFDPLQDEQPPAGFVGGVATLLVGADNGAFGIELWLAIATCSCGACCTGAAGIVGIGTACITGCKVGCGNVPKKLVAIRILSRINDDFFDASFLCGCSSVEEQPPFSIRYI